MKKRRQNIILAALILSVVWAGGCGEKSAQPPVTESLTVTQAAPAPIEEQPTAQPTATAPLPTFTAPPPTASPTTLPTSTATAQPTQTPSATLRAEPQDEAPAPLARTVADLQGLPLDDFFEQSYEMLLLRSPQALTYQGTAASFGLRNDQLDDLSDVYIRQTQELESAILDLLRAYDRAALTPGQQLSYDVYEWYLDDLLRGHEFMYHDYLVHDFLGSYHDELERLFIEIHPLDNKQDAEDYVSRLARVDEQVQQLLQGLELREQAGVIPPLFVVHSAKAQISRYLQTSSQDPATVPAEALTVYTVFREKLQELDLSTEEKQALLDAALLEIRGSFAPAYMQILTYLEHLATIASDDAGVWKFPDGDAYYAYILRQQTTTDLTPQQVHELGLYEVARIRAEMRQAFDDLGYPQDASLPELIERAVTDAGFYDISTQAAKDDLIARYEEILAEADQKLDAVFDLRPQARVVVAGGPIGGYYVSGSMDGSRPGAYHVATGGSWAPKYRMAPVAYHEAIPGHHFQIALAQELDLPTFRNDVFFNAYGEGWAMYAERLAWELGFYEDDPYGNVGRLELELLRAVRLVVDTGIHSLRWTREEARSYMTEVLGHYGEVDRYIVLPAQATGYKVGMLRILELRQRAMDQLGDRFDIKEFHNVVLSNGSMPLDILERVVQDYIDAKGELGN